MPDRLMKVQETQTIMSPLWDHIEAAVLAKKSYDARQQGWEVLSVHQDGGLFKAIFMRLEPYAHPNRAAHSSHESDPNGSSVA